MMMYGMKPNNLLLFPIMSFKLIKLLELTLGTALNDVTNNESHRIHKSQNQSAPVTLCKEDHSESVRVCSFPVQTENWLNSHIDNRTLVFRYNGTVFKVSLHKHQVNLPDAIISYRTGLYGEMPIYREDISKGLHVLYKGNIVFQKNSLPFSAQWDGVYFKGKTFILSVYFELLCSSKSGANFYQTGNCFTCRASCANTKSMHSQNSTATHHQDLFEAYSEYPELAFSHTPSARANHRRKQRQAASFPPKPLSCALHLVADHLFYKHVGDGSVLKTINVMFDVVNDADALFRSTDFDGDLHGDNVGFIVGKVTIFPDTHDPGYNFTQPYLNANDYLKHFSLLDFSDFCLGVAFTYRDFYGLAGTAYQAYSDDSMPGGICQERLKHNFDLISFNTALITFLNFGKRLRHSQVVLIVAHELGHSFGARHDLTTECSSEFTGGHFLMRSSMNSGILPNNARFSNCSVRSMLPVIQKKGSCLLYTQQISQCGNSVPEPGEECDCGSSKVCQFVDPCCTPADEIGLDKPCRVRHSSGKLCSPKVNPCCTNSCQYISQSAKKLCSHLHYCYHRSKCDGLSGHCPLSKPLPDGAFCNNGFQVCIRGMCSHPACEYHNLSTCVCPEPNNQCKLCCMDPRTAACKPARSYGIVSSSGEILQQPGEQCFTNGYCDSSFMCLNPLNIVIESSNVFGFRSSFELEMYVRKYWLYYAVGTFCLLFVISLLLLPYRLDDNRFMKAIRYGKLLDVYGSGDQQVKLYRKTLHDINTYYTLAILRCDQAQEPKDYIEAVARLKLFFPEVHISYLSRVANLSASESIAVKILLLQGFKMSTLTQRTDYFQNTV